MYISKSLSKLRLNRYEKPLSPLCFCTAHLKNFVTNQGQNPFPRNYLLYLRYVIKELVDAFSCSYMELWMHLGSLESTQEARVALGHASSNSYASLVLFKLPACIHNGDIRTLSMNQFLNTFGRWVARTGQKDKRTDNRTMLSNLKDNEAVDYQGP